MRYDRYGDDLPEPKQYTRVDLFASYDYTDWIRADLTLSNVFDVPYPRDLDRSPGFQARGALTVKFATRRRHRPCAE